MPRPHLPRELRRCVAEGCHRAVVVIAGDVPRGPLWCEPCRDELDPAPRPNIHTTCSLFGCDNPVKVTGRRRRPYELGRPVYCSVECRSTVFRQTRLCVCGKPITGNAKRFRYAASFCSRQCSIDDARAAPRDCARCARRFQPPRPTSRYCSRKCGSRGEGRVQPVLRTCPVCGGQDVVAPDRVGRPCSKACSNTWRTRPDWVPASRHAVDS